MRALGVIEDHICINAFSELVFRIVVSPVYFFFLERCEKCFRYRVILRPSRAGEGLDNVVHAKELAKGIRCVLCALVAVKCQTSRLLPIYKCSLKGGRKKISAVF